LLWASEAAQYGGLGATEPEVDGVWTIAGRSAVVLMPV
jgi:hypothetical protein